MTSNYFPPRGKSQMPAPAASVATQPTTPTQETTVTLTKHEQFAMHAPSDVPEWFVHTPPPKTYPDLPDWRTLPQNLQATARDWLMDSGWDLEGELEAFQIAVYAHKDGQREWERLNRESRYFQWRWHYACLMVNWGKTYYLPE